MELLYDFEWTEHQFKDGDKWRNQIQSIHSVCLIFQSSSDIFSTPDAVHGLNSQWVYRSASCVTVTFTAIDKVHRRPHGGAAISHRSIILIRSRSNIAARDQLLGANLMQLYTTAQSNSPLDVATIQTWYHIMRIGRARSEAWCTDIKSYQPWYHSEYLFFIFVYISWDIEFN